MWICRVCGAESPSLGSVSSQSILEEFRRLRAAPIGIITLSIPDGPTVTVPNSEAALFSLELWPSSDIHTVTTVRNTLVDVLRGARTIREGRKAFIDAALQLGIKVDAE